VDAFFVILSIIVLLSFILIAKNTFSPSQIRYILRMNVLKKGNGCSVKINGKDNACTVTEIVIPYNVTRDPQKLTQISSKIVDFAIRTSSLVSIISTVIPVNIGELNKSRLLIEIEKRKSINKKPLINEQILTKIDTSQPLNYYKHLLLICTPSLNHDSIEFHVNTLESYLKTVNRSITLNPLPKDDDNTCQLVARLPIPPINILDEHTLEENNILGFAPPRSCPPNSIKIGFTETGVPHCLIWPQDFERHIAIIGPTGAGKTTLLAYMIRAMLYASLAKTIYVIDPKGDLRNMLGYNKSIIYLEPVHLDGILQKIEKPETFLDTPLVIDEAWRVFSRYPDKILALLRQARSRGLYLIYATQNPWDLPLSAANNTGTYIIFGSPNYSYLRGISELTGLHYDEARIIYTLRSGEYLVKPYDSRPHKLHLPSELTTYLRSPQKP